MRLVPRRLPTRRARAAKLATACICSALVAAGACGTTGSTSEVPARDDSGAAAATDLSHAGTGSAPEPTGPADGDATRATAGGPADTSAPAAGELPQTEDKPSVDSAQFRTGVKSLWRAIVEDNPDLALGFFFPLPAYRQVKSITNPDADYENRLIRQYREDIGAWHRQLGSDPGSATFVRIDVPGDAAQWMKPGSEYNKIGYWRVLNARLVYEVGGRQKSFTIASMISWRGEWYVVHLAAIK